MRKILEVSFAVLMLVGASALLSACHTTAGAGQDISATGHTISHTADKLTP
jgi:predicted small secreted protein